MQFLSSAPNPLSIRRQSQDDVTRKEASLKSRRVDRCNDWGLASVDLDANSHKLTGRLFELLSLEGSRDGMPSSPRGINHSPGSSIHQFFIMISSQGRSCCGSHVVELFKDGELFRGIELRRCIHETVASLPGRDPYREQHTARTSKTLVTVSTRRLTAPTSPD